MPDRVGSPALRGTWIGTALGLLNPVMRRLLASPLHWPLSRFFMLVSWTGRKTGATYTTPVSYVRERDVISVTTGDRWWRFLPDTGEIRVCVSGRWRTARAEPVTDRDRSIAEHQKVCRRHSWFRLLSGIPRASGGGPDRDAIARSIDAGRTLVRIELR